MNFVYFSTLAWDEAEGAHNPTQMARALARQGHSGVFVEPQPSAARDAGTLPLRVVALTEPGMSPVQLRRAWYGLDSGELDRVAQHLRELIQGWDASTPRVAIFSAPFDPFVRLMPLLRAHRFTVVYYAMDDFAAAPALGYTQFVAGAEEYLTRHSDVLCGVTPHVAESLERFGKHAHVIPNGVEIEAWRAARRSGIQDVPDVKRGDLTLVFWGTLMESMFDADLVAHTAEARPQWMIHLFGAADPEPHRSSVVARLQGYPNVIFHGAVAHAELARYASVFDAALAPFPDNAFTRGRDPIKVYEYLAGHLPVAAAHAPQLASLPYVEVAHSAGEFVGAIERAAKTSMDERALDAFLARQTWDARADCLLELLRFTETDAPQDDLSDGVLPSFAKPDAAAVMRYASALEHELAQVQAWAQELERNAQARGLPERVRRFVAKLK